MSNPKPKPTVFPAHSHDHDHCIEQALSDAANVCAGNGARLTDLRRRVLEIIWQSHKPLGAYSILEALRQDGRSAAPPTVYRALEFLLEQGLAHRIASLNAFAGCTRPGHGGQGQFLICHACGSAAELNDAEVSAVVTLCASAHGFRPEHHTIEITGTCPSCQE